MAYLGQWGSLSTRRRIGTLFNVPLDDVETPDTRGTMPAYETDDLETPTVVQRSGTSADTVVAKTGGGVIQESALLRDVAIMPRAPANGGGPVVARSEYGVPQMHLPPMPERPMPRAGAAAAGNVVTAGIFGGLFSNPLLLVGIAAGAWFLFGRK